MLMPDYANYSGTPTVNRRKVLAMKAIIVAVLLLASVARADDSCKETNFGKCYSVHGRYAIYVQNNGIWVIGSKRLLLATSDKLDAMILDKGNWLDYAVIGDFTVCPRSRYEVGHKQQLCVQSYKNTRIVKWDHNSQ